jgi:hypothetical protein
MMSPITETIAPAGTATIAAKKKTNPQILLGPHGPQDPPKAAAAKTEKTPTPRIRNPVRKTRFTIKPRFDNCRIQITIV